jgi:hypothetical protein
VREGRGGGRGGDGGGRFRFGGGEGTRSSQPGAWVDSASRARARRRREVGEGAPDEWAPRIGEREGREVARATDGPVVGWSAGG